jgi:hypothetical protein
MAKAAKAAKPKAATKSKVKAKAAAKSKMAAKSDVRVFPVDTRFQKMARREGGVPRDQAIERAQIAIEEAKFHFDDWLDGELKEFVSLMKKVEGAKIGADWIKTANFHSRQLRDSATTFGFELLAFVAGSLCEILDSIEAGSECNIESITCHIESLLLAGQASYRHLKPAQVPDLTEGLNRVMKRVTAQPST